MGYAPDTVAQVVRLIQGAEYKRRQSAVGIRITPRGFGKDWRYPITSAWNEWTTVPAVEAHPRIV
jgi:NAD+ synthase (glutamine-hydrolysing)